jgi:hypothetical protein
MDERGEPSKRTVSLRDVQNETPEESEEEARVMADIEKSDPTTTQRQLPPLLEAQLSILLPRGEPSPNTNHGTVEDELLAATTAIHQLYYEGTEDGQEAVEGPPPAEIFRSRKYLEANADIFAANAGKIFHRFQKTKTNHGCESDGDIEHNNIDAKGKRRKKSAQPKPNWEALNEFREIILSSKETTYGFVRNRLLYVILPSTALACL